MEKSDHPIQKYLDGLIKIGLRVNKPIALLDKSDFIWPFEFQWSRDICAQNMEIHCCYKNSYEFIHQCILNRVISSYGPFKDIVYCEGLMAVAGVPIEHAWVKVIYHDDTVKYIDPTKTYVLGETLKDITEYAVMLEYSWRQLIEVLLAKKKYGPYFKTVIQ